MTDILLDLVQKAVSQSMENDRAILKVVEILVDRVIELMIKVNNLELTIVKLEQKEKD